MRVFDIGEQVACCPMFLAIELDSCFRPCRSSSDFLESSTRRIQTVRAGPGLGLASAKLQRSLSPICNPEIQILRDGSRPGSTAQARDPADGSDQGMGTCLSKKPEFLTCRDNEILSLLHLNRKLCQQTLRVVTAQRHQATPHRWSSLHSQSPRAFL